MKKYYLFILIVVLAIGSHQAFKARAQYAGGGNGTINVLPELVSTTSPSSAITQRTANRPLKITGPNATSTFEGNLFTGNLFEANSDRVIVAPYGIATTSSNNNWGATSGTSKEYLTFVHQSRIRQNGCIERIGMNNVNKTGLTAFYVKVWRQNDAGTFDIIGTSENIVSNITAGGLSTTTLASPICGVREGDYLGYRIESAGFTVNNFSATTTPSDGGSYSVANTVLPVQGYSWTSQTYTASQYLVLEAYMQAPIFVSISDSILTGHGGTTLGSILLPDNYSFAETTALSFPRGSVPWILGNRTGWTYQNMGIGGVGSASVVARFTKDVIDLHPKFVLIEIGSNDLSSLTAAQIAANWQTMIDAATANGIKVVGVLIPPRIAITNANMTKRDQANALIAAQIRAAGGIVVNVDPYVGKFRGGGDVGNLWDQRDEYRESLSGTSHFNMFGYDRFADAIIEAMNGTITTKGKIDAAALNLGGSLTFSPNNPHAVEIPRSTSPNIGNYSLDLSLYAGSVFASSTDMSGGNVILNGGISTGMGSSTELQLWGSLASTTTGIADNARYKILSVSPTGITLNNDVPNLGNATTTFQQCFSKASNSFNGDCFQIRSWTTQGSQNRVDTLMGPSFSGDASPTAGIYISGTAGNVGNVSIGSTTIVHKLGIYQNSALTNTMQIMSSLNHTTSGTPAAGFGAAHAFRLERNAGDLSAAGYFGARWQNIAAETSCIDFAPENAGSGSGTVRGSICGGGQVGFGTTTPGVVGLNIEGQSLLGNWAQAGYFVATSTQATSTFQGGINIRSMTPATSGATCTAGDMSWDASFIYICTSANTWKRSALSAF